jgi:ABC-type transporter MlaC component
LIASDLIFVRGARYFGGTETGVGCTELRLMNGRTMSTLMTRRKTLFLLGLLSMLGAVPAFADDNAAEGYVQKIGEEVLKVANAGSRGKPTRNRFAALLTRYVNLRGITIASLGTYQKQLPPGDTGKLNDLVTTYAAALFAWYVDDFKGSAFEVERSAKQGNFTVVYSKIKQGGSDEAIVWYLSPGGGGYRIVDLNVKGVRLSSAMRQRFADELKKSHGDFGPLYAMLAEAETW